jgi:hypothetical protein
LRPAKHQTLTRFPHPVAPHPVDRCRRLAARVAAAHLLRRPDGLLPSGVTQTVGLTEDKARAPETRSRRAHPLLLSPTTAAAPAIGLEPQLVGFVRDYRRVFYQGNRPPALHRSLTCLLFRSFHQFILGFALAAGQGAWTAGARRSSPRGPSCSSTSLGQPAYAPSISLCPFFIVATC